jgi:hypothetical protein
MSARYLHQPGGIAHRLDIRENAITVDQQVIGYLAELPHARQRNVRAIFNSRDGQKII